MAWYTEQHLERLYLIKKLQHERFLPLKAIKALLDGREEAFAPEQQQFLQNVRDKIDASLSSRGPVERVLVSDLVRRDGVDMDDVTQADELGLVSIIRRDADGGDTAEASVSADDAWLFDALGELRTLGFTKERGFTVADVAFYHEAMSGMFRQEVGLLSSRLAHLPPDQAARMIERAIPIVNQTLSRLHTQLVREFFGDSF
jgi:DNA-binding transcriptional MerR regulator